MSTDKIILYDLPCQGRCACWSPNVWKTRLVLNYKKIPYTTEWLEHPDIIPKLSALGIPPSTGVAQAHSSPYTVPAILFPTGTAIMDSAVIAPELETQYPSPSLRLREDPDLPGLAQRIVGQMALPLFPVFMPRIGRDVFLEKNKAYWYAKREATFGMPMDEFERTKGGEPAWAAAEAGMVALRDFLRAHKLDEGPFVRGSQPGYADFIIVAMLEAFRRIGRDLFDRVAGFDDGIGKLHAACAEWLQDDQ